MNQQWGSYECYPCVIIIDIRVEGDTAPEKIFCPLCKKELDLDAQWTADKYGYGSRGDISTPH